MPGHVSDENVALRYQAADLIVHPSLAEGGAYIAQEAIHYMKPLAISKIRSTLLHLKRMGGVWAYFDPNQPEDIAKVILEQLRAPICNDKIRVKINNWTWMKLANQYESIFTWVSTGEDVSNIPTMFDFE